MTTTTTSPKPAQAAAKPVQPLAKRTAAKLDKASTVDDVVAAVDGSPVTLARALLLSRGEPNLEVASDATLLHELYKRAISRASSATAE